MTRNNNFVHGSIDQLIDAVKKTHPKDAAVLRRYIDSLRLLKKYGCNKYAIDSSQKYQAWGIAGKLVARGDLPRTRLYGLILKEEAALEPEVIA